MAYCGIIYFVGANFRGMCVLPFCGDVISCMCQFSVSVGKLSLLKLVFIEDVNSWVSAMHDNHEN